MEKRSSQLTPEQDALEHIVAFRDKPFLEVRVIDSFRGRGVFTHKSIEPSAFVVEYRGNRFCHEETRPEDRCGDTLNGFLYIFSWNGARWSVDASKEGRSLGRFVNDNHISPNCEMKKIVCDGKPHLCLFAIKEISAGDEITYNYGTFPYPWRSKEFCDGSSTSNTDFGTSAPHNQKVEGDSAASAAYESSDDDGELPGPSSDNISPQLDFDASSKQEEEEEEEKDDDGDKDWVAEGDGAPLSSDEQEYEPSQDKSQNTSFTKKNYCFVCGKGVNKIARHFLRHVDEEPAIAEALALPKGSRERKAYLSRLRNRGNYKHNQEVLRSNSGVLKARRRPLSRAACTKSYVHCTFCKGMFLRVDLWKHIMRCPEKTNSEKQDKARLLGEMTLEQSQYSHKFPDIVWKILLQMKQDEIAYVIQNDYHLVQLTQSLNEKHRLKPNKHDSIRQRLREMGRLLLALHQKSVFSFEEAIKPRQFYKVVETVKDIAGFNKEKQSYSNPSLALKLGRSLKKLGLLVLSGTDNKKMVENAKTFLKRCEKEWSGLVSETAAASLSGRKVDNPSTISFTQDVQSFYKYLEKTAAPAIESVKVYDSPETYNPLCRVTLAQVSVLNKCAPELSKMSLKSFQERDDTTKVLSKHFIRINIQSKAGQDVAVLLTSQLVSALTLLVSKRQACGVHADNPFLFAKPDSSAKSLYHAKNCIRAFSRHSKNPEHLRSVHLHKHMARIFQILYLENDELEHLAKLLGHNIRADRDYYRSPEAAVELAKIAKLILAMEKGSLERFKGKSLEEIEIEDELELEENTEEQSKAPADQPQLSDDDEDDDEQQGQQLTPVWDALQHIKTGRDKPFLKAAFINSFKGRGVLTSVAIRPSDFVVEYRGNISSVKETQRKTVKDTLKNFMFDFSWNGTKWCVDASTEDGTLGRLVNDDHTSPNCRMEKIEYKGKPHLCLFALKSISPGEEITYDYGGLSYPWRSKNTSRGPDRSQTDLTAAASSPADQQTEDPAEASSSAGSLSDNDYCEDESNSDDSSASSNDSDASQTPKQLAAALTHCSSDDSDLDKQLKNCSYTKNNYCYVCNKPFTKISRHLFTHRKDVEEIAQVYKLRRNSKERRKMLDILRNRGNYNHNQEVLRTRCGKLKLKGRKSNTTKFKTFAACIYCKGMYNRQIIWRHLKVCPSMTSKRPPGAQFQLLILVGTGLTDPHHISSGVRKMLEKIKKDEIGSIIWGDPYILQLAQCFYYMNEEKQRDGGINQKLRQMGRLLQKLKKESVCSFEEATKPQNFSILVKAVRELVSVNERKTTLSRRGLRQMLGSSLRKIAGIKYARAVKDDADRETVEEAETFMKLCAEEWPTTTSGKLNISSTPTIEFIQDVQRLYLYMEDVLESATQSLTLYAIPLVYTALLRVTVAYVAVLNKNAAEGSKVTLESFRGTEGTVLQADSAAGQSNVEQILFKNMLKMNVKSTAGKKISLILTPALLSAITLLVSKRQTCGVHEKNPFLFARPVASTMNFLRGAPCINMLVYRSGAKNQASLRSPAFRRYMARIFKFFRLTNGDLDELGKLLGCNIRTEREFYQTAEAAADIAKISELLSAVESGCFGRFRGKSLEEIEFPDELQPDVEQDVPEISDPEEEEKKAESSFQTGGFSFTKGCFANKNTRNRSKPKKQKSRSDQAEVNKENEEEEETPSQTKESDAICFSDDDEEDMNVDFNIDSDDDDVRNEENDADDGKDKKSSDDGNHDDDVDMEAEEHEEEEDPDEEQNVDSDGPSAPSNAEMKKNLLACMKEVKIVIPKLDISKLQGPVCSYLYSPEPIQSEPPSSPASNQLSPAQAVHMTCSHCKTNMMMGHTAYQKKGFQDVFCSKNCLFEMFLPKPATKTCHQCHEVISQPQDLIMAAVDNKGTMKDFCGVACLCSFKCYTAPVPPPHAVCNESSTTLSDTVQTLCSDACLDICENCSRLCRQAPLRLKLGDQTKTLCNTGCLEEFKEDIKTLQRCFICLASRPGSDMVCYQITEDTLELFCNRYCVSSYKLRPPIPFKCHNERSALSDEQSEGTVDTTSAISAAKEDVASPAAEPGTPPPISAEKNKKCFNCLQVITRPQSIILAPVDDSGDMKELCSNTCLSSIKSKITALTPSVSRPRLKCKMCNNFTFCTHKLTLDDVVHSFCSTTCFISYHKANNLTLLMCAVCSAFCSDKHLKINVEDSGQIICGERCLIKFKENIRTCQLCRMCQTLHRMSDMVEDKNKEGGLVFFCSNRCMMVYKAQTVTVSEKSLPSSEEVDVKPSLPDLTCIKEEPVDEETTQHLPASVCPQAIKDEPTKVELQVSSAVSLMGEPALTLMDRPVSCSNCKKVLMGGETIYQRKAHTDMFCSTSCLVDFYQKKTCSFCLQVITQTQDVLQAPVDNVGTKKDFCSQACLSSFNYKNIVSTKIPLATVSQSQCSMCTRHCISKHEVILQDVIHKMCSQPCFLRFCSMNSVSVCENCHSHCTMPLTFKMEDGNKTLCGAQCVAQFKQKIQTAQPCAMCRSSHLMSDMMHNKNSEDVVELFCSSRCALASKIQAVSTSGASLSCYNCGKTTHPACHLAMSDASIRTFCSLTCAMAFKEKQTSDPDNLLCDQCQQIIKTTPRVIQRKEDTYFTCSLTCSHEFKRVNNMVGTCEFCKHDRIIKDVERIDDKDCFFCSEGCRTIFCHELAEQWGEECRSCAYCLSICRAVVMAAGDKAFCSNACRSKYRELHSSMAKCDACGCKGKLQQSLRLVGEVKHFCDWNCLLRFCKKKDTGSITESCGSAGAAASSPIIADVISLARPSEKSTQLGSVTDMQVKVVGHVSVQTVSKELRNKSMLCTPLVHNKGSSCVPETAETAAQTEKYKVKVVTRLVPVPVPLPVYVPLPLNMYTQYTPTPVGLPVPLPVPVLLPMKSGSSESEMKTSNEGLRPERQKEDGDTTELETQSVDKMNNQDSSISSPLSELPALPLLRKVRSENKWQRRGETSRRILRRPHSTESGVDAWRRWVQCRHSQSSLSYPPADVLLCSAGELSEGLCLFVSEVKQPDGEPYPPDCLFYLCLSIQQHLLLNHRLENIFSDLIYTRFSTKFTRILKHFRPSGHQTSCVHEEFLWDCKQLGASSPAVLLNTLLFFCCKYFGFSTVEQHRQLSFTHLVRYTKTKRDGTKTTFLRFYPPTSENQAESDGVPAKKQKKSNRGFLEMMENLENPLRCPVKIYEFYLTKCSESVRWRTDLFYLQPDRSCVSSSPHWFTPAPLDDDAMEAMIVRILTIQEVQEED